MGIGIRDEGRVMRDAKCVKREAESGDQELRRRGTGVGHRMSHMALQATTRNDGGDRARERAGDGARTARRRQRAEGRRRRGWEAFRLT
jgi:hypothetical protein